MHEPSFSINMAAVSNLKLVPVNSAKAMHLSLILLSLAVINNSREPLRASFLHSDLCSAGSWFMWFIHTRLLNCGHAGHFRTQVRHVSYRFESFNNTNVNQSSDLCKKSESSTEAHNVNSDISNTIWCTSAKNYYSLLLITLCNSPPTSKYFKVLLNSEQGCWVLKYVVCKNHLYSFASLTTEL